MAIQIADKDSFHDMIAEDFVIVDFFGTTCAPCKLFAKILEDVEAEVPFLNIVKINTTENREIAREYNINAVPTIHFYKDGKLLEERIGLMQAQELKEVIARYMYA